MPFQRSQQPLADYTVTWRWTAQPVRQSCNLNREFELSSSANDLLRKSFQHLLRTLPPDTMAPIICTQSRQLSKQSFGMNTEIGDEQHAKAAISDQGNNRNRQCILLSSGVQSQVLFNASPCKPHAHSSLGTTLEATRHWEIVFLEPYRKGKLIED